MPLNPIIRDNENATKLMRYCEAHKHDVCKVLNKEEELELIASLKDDPEKLQEALIMHNVAMVFKLASQFMSATNSFDETVQNGMYGLCYAAKKFDFTQTKTKFSTYAHNWIYKYVWWTYWKDTQNTKDPLAQAVSLDSSISDFASTSKSSESDNGNLANYLENHIDPNDPKATSTDGNLSNLSAQNIYEDIQKYMLSSDFTDLDRLVFDRSFVGNSLTVRQISSTYDIPLKEVKSSYAKIMALLKNMLKEKNITSVSDAI